MSWPKYTTEEIVEELSKLTTTPQVAGAALGLAKNATYEAIRRGEIQAERFGGKIVIPTAPLRKRLGLEAA